MSVFHVVPGTYPVKIKKYKLDEAFRSGDTVRYIGFGKIVTGIIKSCDLKYNHPEPWENRGTYEEHLYYTIRTGVLTDSVPHIETHSCRIVLTEKSVNFI
jgi:hypothetical protein